VIDAPGEPAPAVEVATRSFEYDGERWEAVPAENGEPEKNDQ